MVDYQEVDRMLDEAAQVWKDTHDRSMDVDSLKKDPITRLLMTAILHQTDKIESEICDFQERIMGKLIESYPTQYGMQPIPAIGMLQAKRSHKLREKDKIPTRIDGNTTFCFSKPGRDISFMPLFNMKVFDLSITSVTQIDGNQWLVELDGGDVESDISGLSIYLPNVMCERIKMHIGTTSIDICNICDFDRLPFVNWFQDENQMTTLLNIYDRLCFKGYSFGIVDNGFSEKIIPNHIGKPSFLIEVIGSSTEIKLSRENILFNCVPVCNMVVHSTSISKQDKEKKNHRIEPQIVLNEGEHFLGISSQTFPEGMSEHIAIRDVGTSRLEDWSNHISKLIDLYDSDYCFLNSIMDSKSNTYLREFAKILDRVKIAEGKYIVPTHPEKLFSDNIETVVLKWFSTMGNLANDIPQGSKLSSNTAQLDKENGGVLISSTYGGRNKLSVVEERKDIMRYHLQSGDRIVTSSDIRLFCRTKLLELFSITTDASAIHLENRIIENRDGFKEKVMNIVIFLSENEIDLFRIQSTLEKAIRSRLSFDSKIKIIIKQHANV